MTCTRAALPVSVLMKYAIEQNKCKEIKIHFLVIFCFHTTCPYHCQLTVVKSEFPTAELINNNSFIFLNSCCPSNPRINETILHFQLYKTENQLSYAFRGWTMGYKVARIMLRKILALSLIEIGSTVSEIIHRIIDRQVDGHLNFILF